MRKIIYKLGASFFILFLVLGFLPVLSFAQQEPEQTNFGQVITGQASGGYGKTQAIEPGFTVVLGSSMPSASSFTVSGTITAQKEVTPNLKIAYGVDKENLNFLAPTTGTFFFNSPLAAKDSAYVQPLSISITHLQGDIKNNTIYFTVVDSKNPHVAYTNIQTVTQGGQGAVNYSVPKGPSQPAPTGMGQKNGGLMEGICDGETCTFNDLLKIFKNFWKFILYLIVPIIAIMTAWIGFNFMQSGAEYREKAKEMIWGMVKGLLLIFFAWFIVKTILDFTLYKGENSCFSFLGTGKIEEKCVTEK